MRIMEVSPAPSRARERANIVEFLWIRACSEHSGILAEYQPHHAGCVIQARLLAPLALRCCGELGAPRRLLRSPPPI
jgi:hypothetical protein